MRRFASWTIALSCFGVAARAGDMTAAVNSGVLTITDSSSDDTLQIDQIGLLDPTAVRLTPSAGTTVNGSASAVILTGLTKDVRLNHTGGNDDSILTEMAVPRDLLAKASVMPSFDLVCAGVEVGRDIKVDAKADAFGFGANSVGGAVVKRDVKISAMLSGDATGILGQLRVLRNFTWKGAPGVDTLLFTNIAEVNGFTMLDLGAGNDSVTSTMNTHFAGKFKVKGSGGSKSCALAGTFHDETSFDLGASAGNISITSALVGGPVLCKAAAGGQCNATLTATTIAEGLTVVSKGGNETIVLDAVEMGGDVVCKLGPGDNYLAIDNSTVIHGDLVQAGSAGEDTLSFVFSTVFGDVVLQYGSAPAGESDAFGGVGSTVYGNMRCTGTGGSQSAGLQASTCLGEFRSNLGSGSNSLLVNDGSYKSIVYSGTSGQDAITLTGTELEVKGDITAQLGDGPNTVSIGNTTCWGNLVVKAGNGDDNATLTSTTVFGSTLFALGGGANVGP